MTSSATNMVDQEWIPVIDHGDDVLVTLRAALKRAHEFDGLGTTLLPIEREAMLRFLESLAAAVLRGMNTGDLADERSIPPDAVDRFFDECADRFDLADPDRPFMQEWHTQPDSEELKSRYVPVHQLHLRVPGRSSAAWGVSGELRDATDPGVLAILLVVAWFHGKPSNAAGASFYRPTSGSKRSPISGAPSGAPWDTVFHLLGRTLAETVLHNIPTAWLDSSYRPVWLDQDAEPTPAEAARTGSLWRCTWTPNRALVAWTGGQAVSYTVGLTSRAIPQVGDIDGKATPSDIWKANSKAMPSGDYCRVRRVDPSKPEKANLVYAPPNLGTAEGYEEWYRSEIAEALTQWVYKDRVLPASKRNLLGFHNERGDTYGNRSLSNWGVVPLAQLTVTGDPALALRTVTSHVSYLAKMVGLAVKRGFATSSAPASVTEIKQLVYAALDDPVLEAVALAGDGVVVGYQQICKEMSRRAVRAFIDATEPMLTPATSAAVHRSRAEYARLARKEIK